MAGFGEQDEKHGPFGIDMEEVSTLVALNGCAECVQELECLASAKADLLREVEAFPPEGGDLTIAGVRRRRLENMESAATQRLLEVRSKRAGVLRQLFTLGTDHALAQHIYDVSRDISQRFTDTATALGYIYQAKHKHGERPLQELMTQWAVAKPREEALAFAARGRGAFLELEILAEEVERENVESIVGRSLDIFRDILCLPSANVESETVLYVERLVYDLKYRVEQAVGPDSSNNTPCPYIVDMLLRGIVRSFEDFDMAAQAALAAQRKGKVACKRMDHVQAISVLGDVSFDGNRLALNFLGQLAADRSLAWDVREVALMQVQRVATFDRYTLQFTNRKDLFAAATVMMGPLLEKLVNHNVLATAKRCLSETVSSAPLSCDGDDFVRVLASAASSAALMAVTCTGSVHAEAERGQLMARECSRESFTREWEELVRDAQGLRAASSIEEAPKKPRPTPASLSYRGNTARERRRSGEYDRGHGY